MNALLKHSLSYFLVFLLLASCGTKDAPAEKPVGKPVEKPLEKQTNAEHAITGTLTADQYRMAGIELGAVEMKNLSSGVKVNGMLDSPPQNVVSVSPRIGGYVRSTPLLQGLRVHKGQTLAVLEHEDVIRLKQDFLETRSRLEFAEAEFKRQQALQRDTINAVKTFQQSAADYKTLQSRFAALKQRLSLIGVKADNLRDNAISASYTITSPIEGYVAEVNITLGKFVSPNDVLCRIINPDHVHAELTVFERDAPKLHTGQRVRVTLVNETVERTAKVYLIGREIMTDRTVRVHAHLDTEDGRLLPRTALKAFIELGEQSVSAVPDAALVSASDKDYIFIAVEIAVERRSEKRETSNTFAFQMVEVRRGIAEGGFVEVLLPGNVDRTTAKIVVKGAYSLLAMVKKSEGGEE
jgi:membrane fusion protein, heavy metal efflux system